MILKIGNIDASDLLSGYKVSYETLLSSKSGRNARGNNTVEIVNRKYKVNCSFGPMTQAQMQSFLSAVQAYVLSVQFFDPRSGAVKTIRAYTGTPEPETYYVDGVGTMYKPLNLNFIEL